MRSPRTKKKNEEKVTYDAARKLILEAANNYLARSTAYRVLSQRHIQEAVCIVRRRLLLSDATLRAAGFAPVGPRPQPRREPWGGRGGFVRGDSLQRDFVGRPRK